MDDDGHVTRPELRSLAGLWRIWFDVGATAHYYPLLNTAFWIEYYSWGEGPALYHLINVLQHASAAALVFIIMRQLSLPGAIWGALLFALHPVHVDSVAWISEQKNTLSTLLGLAAVVVYLRFDQSRHRWTYTVALLFFIGALLTKTVTAVLGPALLVTLWWKRGKLELRRDVLPLVPWIVAGAALGIVSAWFEQSHGNANGDSFRLPILERGLLAYRAVRFYATKLIWPQDLVYIPERWSVQPIKLALLLNAGAQLALSAVLFWQRSRFRSGWAVLLLFTGMLFPVLGFLNINWFLFSYVADHFQYLPSVALLVPAGALLGRASRLSPPWVTPAVRGGAILICAGLGFLTFQRSHVYASAETLYRDTVARNPSAWLAHHNLAVILMERREANAEALYHLEETLKLYPDHARAHNNYAIVLSRMQRYEQALQHFQRSLELQYNVPEVHTNAGLTLRAAGAPITDAIREFRTALSIDSHSLDAQLALAQTLASTPGMKLEAFAEYQRALALAPDRGETHREIADLLATIPERRNDAIAHYREAIRLNPTDAPSYINLAAALADNGESPTEAIALLRVACRLDEQSVDAHFNLGLLLARTPSGAAEGLEHLRAAAQMQPNDPELLTTIARVLIAVPEARADAARLLERVVRLRPTSAEARANYGVSLALLPGRDEEANRELRQALALDPSSRAAREALAKLTAKN